MSSKKKTTTMDESKPALVPKLRFPEFRNTDVWKEVPIGEKVDLLSGYPFDGLDITQDSSGTRLLRGINITEGRIRHSSEIDRYYPGAVEGLEKFRVREHDLVIGMDGSKVGKNSAMVTKEDEDALLIQRVARLRATNSTLMQFIYQQINSTTFHTYVDKINTSSGIPHISAQQIKDFTIGFPSAAEQQKIAECMSSVDELMAFQTRKVDAIKTHKKGLMQQLFPREGETQPRLRFPEFQNSGEWTPTIFGALGLDVSDGNYSSKYPSQSDFVANGVPFLRANNLKFGTVSDDDMRFISKEQHSQIIKGHLKQGDILITTRGDLGTVALVPDRHIGSNINAQIVRINSGNKLVNTFLFQLLDYSRVIGLFDSLSTGTALKQLPIGKLNQLALRIPKIREEQQSIASCLSTLDSLITAETQKLEVLKTHKKGLMQQLFPFPEEI